MNAWRYALVAQLTLGLGLCTVTAHADPAVSLGLSHNQVSVTTGFSGEQEFLFGNATRATDIVVRVTSMKGAADLSRKKRIGPFWLNGGKFHLANAPKLLYLLSNRPLAEIASRDELKRYGLTFRSNLAPLPASTHTRHGKDLNAMFVRLKENNGSYQKVSDDVRIRRGSQFLASFTLPAGTPIGAYRVSMYAFRNGRMIEQQSANFRVREVGLERWVSRTAVHDAGTFGVLFTLIAITLGLSVSMSLQPRRPQTAPAGVGAPTAAPGFAQGMALQTSLPARLVGLLRAAFSRFAASLLGDPALHAALALAEAGDFDGAALHMAEYRRKSL